MMVIKRLPIMDIECPTKKILTQGLSPSLKVKSQIIPDTVQQPYMEHPFCQKRGGRRPKKKKKNSEKIAKNSVSSCHLNLHSCHQMEMSQTSSEMNPEMARDTDDVARAR